ncbi:MAG: DUF2281 domain-containing protein [Blastocatellia bacterium]
MSPASFPSNRWRVGKARQPGTVRGTVLYMAPDFDAPLEDFKKYTECGY